jgi:hypothetical protein
MEKLQVKLTGTFKQVKAEVLERKNVTNISQAPRVIAGGSCNQFFWTARC